MSKNKNKYKKIFAATAVLTVATVSMNPIAGIFANTSPQTATVNGVNYVLVNGTYQVGSIVNDASTSPIVIPEKVNGVNVTSVGNDAFNHSEATSISFQKPENITSISAYSFHNVQAKNAISLPNITKVPIYAFNGSNFSSINLDGNKITEIETSSFYNTKATNNLSLMNITTVPANAFESSNFSSINLDENKITSIGSYAFNKSKATNAMSLPNITTVPDSAFRGSNFNSINLDSDKITSITSNAFNASMATNSISLMNITTVPSSAFYGSNFSGIHLNSDKIITVAISAFYNAKATNSISLMNLTTINGSVFYGSSFSEINLNSDKITSISTNAFYNAKATNSISLMNITNVPGNSFTNSNFSEINFDWTKIKTYNINTLNTPTIKEIMNNKNKTISIKPDYQLTPEKITYQVMKSDSLNGSYVVYGNPINTSPSKEEKVIQLPDEAGFYKVQTNLVYPDVAAARHNASILSNSLQVLPNTAPIILDTIESKTILSKNESITINLSNHFKDNDIDDVIIYTVNSDNSNKVNASINGDLLTLTGISKGSTNVIITATDKKGEKISQTFETTVNNSKPTVNEIPKQFLKEKDESISINLNDYFQDNDGDNLNYSVSADNENVEVSIDGSIIKITAKKSGESIISIKAHDDSGDFIDTTIEAMVDGFTPIAPSEPIDIEDMSDLTNGTVKLDDIFEDENPTDLIFKLNILVNEPDADVRIDNGLLVVENPKQKGLISVEVEVTNIHGKTTTVIININVDEKDIPSVIVELEKDKEIEGQDGKATLQLMQGEFTLKTADVNHFGKIKLKTAKQTVTTDFTQDFGVVDARGTQEGWYVTVSATPFTVETFDGFIGLPHQLPLGSLALVNPTNIERVGHLNVTDGLPTTGIQEYTILDNNNAIQLLNAEKGKGMGEFKFGFSKALSLTVDAVTAKIDTINYPDSSTPYKSTITWDLVSGPQS